MGRKKEEKDGVGSFHSQHLRPFAVPMAQLRPEAEYKVDADPLDPYCLLKVQSLVSTCLASNKNKIQHDGSLEHWEKLRFSKEKEERD